MGNVFSLDDNDNESRENDRMLNKSAHRGASNQRKNKNKNTTSKNKNKKNVSFSEDCYDDTPNDTNNDTNNDDHDENQHQPEYNDNDIAEPIAKKRKPRKQSSNSTKKRRYN